MSVKIGEALIGRGLITPQQLNRALQMQLIFGGHLGTCLIELGFIDETSLGTTLSEILGMRCAPREAFDDIPPDVIRTIPQGLVKKVSVVPIGLEGRELHVAAIHAKSLGSLSSATGYKIVPYVAPEIRIVQAMERYYGIVPRRRYIKLSCEVGPPAKLSQPTAGIPLSVMPGPDPFQIGLDKRTPAQEAPDASVDMGPVLALGALSRQMSQVLNHWQLGEVILEYAAERMKRCILFEVVGDEAQVRSWRGDDLDAELLNDLSVPVTTDSIFALVLEDSYYRGAVPEDFASEAFFAALGIEVPREILILPIYGDERLEAILYGDGGQGEIEEATESHLLLSENIALAMKMLSFKIQLHPGQ